MMEFTTTALFLFSTFYGDAPADVKISEHTKPLPTTPAEMQVVDHPLTLEEYIREYFKETPMLAEIAKCESRFRHFGTNGKVLRGELTAEDIGVMQINSFYHEDRAEKLGFDLHTLDGNLAYAKWLYNKESAAPWYSSSKCWQKSDVLAKATSVKATTN